MNPTNLNQIIPKLMGQLKGQNANGFKMVSNLMQNGGNPNAILKQMLSQLKPEQKQQILNTAKGYGCPTNILSQLQNIK